VGGQQRCISTAQCALYDARSLFVYRYYTCGSTVAYSGKPMVQITTIVSCVFPLQKVDVPHRPLQSVFSRSSSLQWPTRLQLSSFVIEPRPHAPQSSLRFFTLRFIFQNELNIPVRSS